MAQDAIAALAEEIKKLRESQEEMSRKVGRSGGRKDSYHFKRKANEVQHKFNEEVEDALEEVEEMRCRGQVLLRWSKMRRML